MRKSFLLIVILLLGLLIAPVWSGHTGYLLIEAFGYTIETSVVVASVCLVLLWAAILLVWTLITRLFAGQLWTRRWLQGRREKRAVTQLRLALNAWFNRDYKAAAELADQSKLDHPDPQLAFALAAAAYGESGNLDAQRRMLTEARIAGFDDENLEILQLLNTQDAEEALTLARTLTTRKKLNPALWRAIAEQLTRFAHWNTLRDLLPRIEASHALLESRLHKIKRLCYQAYFKHTSDSEKLLELWKRLDRKARRNAAIRIAYVEVLVSKGLYQIASKVTSKGLARNCLNLHEVLLLSPEQWAHDESLHDWAASALKQHPKNPDILQLYAATRFIQKEYGLAEKALREALAARPEQSSFRLLGETLLAANQPQGALEAFRKASGTR
ncbi:MAG: heme biosynthesis-associated TPR repeat domain protein [Idiomarinaceae bacterium HL-53]|nr:MAG: heme biosynthesis-associated TPR repeat domain protein [Idiomarinaceae bacterium HL-53]CUS47886.1 heme biosynthesis-associated TPR protein [Idiomarinaceae bacterium HL-53]